jgi:preprotein translocase subunit YajC
MLFAAESSGGSNPLSLILIPALLVGFYFLMIRPQKKRLQAQQALTKSIGEGDEIVTTSGVYGFVTAVEGDIVWLEIAEGIDIRISRAAISKRVTAADAPADDAVDEPEPTAPDAVS